MNILNFRSRRNAALNSTGSSGSGDWRDKCRQVLEIIWSHDDSAPFREPVDTIEHPGNLVALLSDQFLLVSISYLVHFLSKKLNKISLNQLTRY